MKLSEFLVSGFPGSESNETQEDVYVASVETDRGVKEQLRLYDTKGLHDAQDLPKHYYSVADGFVLVYSVDSLESFKKVDVLKKEIDKSRDKKEVCLLFFNPPIMFVSPPLTLAFLVKFERSVLTANTLTQRPLIITKFDLTPL